jgi:hypothetical protein
MWTGPLVGDLQRANPRGISESVLLENQMQGALPVPLLEADDVPQLRIGGAAWQIPSLHL